MNINGEVREGSVEIDSDNNLERFKTRRGAEEAVEIHDFQIVSESVLVLFFFLKVVQLRLSTCFSRAVSVNMPSLWFGTGSDGNPILWRRQVLYKIPNQSQPSPPGSSEQRVAEVWPGIRSLLDTECQNPFCFLLTLIQGKYSSIPLPDGWSHASEVWWGVPHLGSCRAAAEGHQFPEQQNSESLRRTSRLLAPTDPSQRFLWLLSVSCCTDPTENLSWWIIATVYCVRIIVHFFHSLWSPRLSVDTLVELHSLVWEVSETLRHGELTPRSESYTKIGSGIVLKKNDLKICKDCFISLLLL